MLVADSKVEWVARALRSGAWAVLPRYVSGEEIVAAIVEPKAFAAVEERLKEFEGVGAEDEHLA